MSEARRLLKLAYEAASAKFFLEGEDCDYSESDLERRKVWQAIDAFLAQDSQDTAETAVLVEALEPFARHFIPSGGTVPGRMAKLDEVEPWKLEDFGRAYAAITPEEAREKEGR